MVERLNDRVVRRPIDSCLEVAEIFLELNCLRHLTGSTWRVFGINVDLVDTWTWGSLVLHSRVVVVSHLGLEDLASRAVRVLLEPPVLVDVGGSVCADEVVQVGVCADVRAALNGLEHVGTPGGGVQLVLLLVGILTGVSLLVVLEFGFHGHRSLLLRLVLAHLGN